MLTALLLSSSIALAGPTLRESATAAQLAWPPPAIWIQIDKSDRELVLFSGDVPVKRYRVGLGGAPSGDKVRQGDSRTPVGTFRVVTRNHKSRFHLFLGLSYPDAGDAARGLEAGWISADQARLIREADAAHRLPPWNTTLGGAIGIHGNGGGADWTLGCIAVEDSEIEELWEVARMGTRVVVRE